MKGERIAKRSSFGAVMRKRLSDITNSHSQQLKLCNLEEHKLPQISQSNQEFVNRLLKEKASLVKLVEERNKIIELSGKELRNMRMNYQKLQLQNWNLAQSNSQMLAELNVGRDKLKALQHELVCKEALLKIKMSQTEAAADKSIHSSVQKEEENSASQCLKTDTKSCNASKRRTARSKSMGSCTAQRAADKEKVETKRRCLRRQSARVKSEETEPEENLFEIEDVKLSVEISMEEEEEDVGGESSLRGKKKSNTGNEEVGRRSSVGRPVRRAVEKVQSYKEVPLKVKMRRAE